MPAYSPICADNISSTAVRQSEFRFLTKIDSCAPQVDGRAELVPSPLSPWPLLPPGGCFRICLYLFQRFLVLPVHYPYAAIEVESMCLEIDDEIIEELAMGRAQGTKEGAHVLECFECKERLRESREWITMFRQAFDPDRDSEELKFQRKPMQKCKAFRRQVANRRERIRR
jgi:hypothetical protein